MEENDIMIEKKIRGEVEVIKPKKKRSAKPEKVYKWYMDGVPGKADLYMPESLISAGDKVSWTHRVTRKYENGKMIAYLVCEKGQIRVFVRGDEYTGYSEEVDTENAE